MKLYIIGPEDQGEGVYSLVAENGELLANHFCSHVGFARGDLVERRAERQQKYREQFGEYSVVMLGQDDMTLEEIVRRNHALAETLDATEATMTEHSPTPWRVEHGEFIIDAENEIAAVAHPLDTYPWPRMKANAEYIVRACNAYDDLIDCLKHIEQLVDDGGLTAPHILRGAISLSVKSVLSKHGGSHVR